MNTTATLFSKAVCLFVQFSVGTGSIYLVWVATANVVTVDYSFLQEIVVHHSIQAVFYIQSYTENHRT